MPNNETEPRDEQDQADFEDQIIRLLKDLRSDVRETNKLPSQLAYGRGMR